MSDWAPHDAAEPDHSAYAGFTGRVGRTISESAPAWREDVRAPDRAPNIVVVLVDDLGFADIGPYGSEIATPTLDRLAADGVVCTDYHTTPLCSPSRAALLTGLNPHRAGFAYPANSDPGYPSYVFELPDNAPTVAESLRAGGYATFMVGKWHLTGDRSLHDAADKSSWPVQRGFDRYFGSLEGFTSLHAPHRLVWDNSPYPVEEFPPDYYLTDDLTDRASAMISSLRANDATKPFLLYLAHHAVHGPVQATAADIEAYDGAYDGGWDELRRARFARQQASGLLPDSVELPADELDPTAAVTPWDDLDEDQQHRYARYMQVYAGAVQAVDRSLAQLVDLLETLGELDNTVIVFTSDNGGTAEGGAEGTRSYFSQFAHVAGLPADWVRDVERPLDLIGGPQTTIHYPRGWGRASNTPFRFFKGDTYHGGVRAPLIVHWPDGQLRAADDDGFRRQYVHVSDLTPTLLELAGVPALTERGGRPAERLDGVSAAAVLRSPAAESRHGDQYAETGGNRGYRSGAYTLVTRHRPGAAFDDAEWALFDHEADPTQTRDLAATQPQTVARLARAWEDAAWANRVFPLDDRGPASALRRPSDDRFGEPVTLLAGTPQLERFRSAQLIAHRDVDVTIVFDAELGSCGVLLAHGDQGGGYVVQVEQTRGGPAARLILNAYGLMERTELLPLAAGATTLEVAIRVRPQFRWDLDLRRGDRVVGLLDVPQLLGMAPFTGISVGADLGGPVDWERHLEHGSWPFSGRLRHVHYEPGPLSADAPAERARIWAEGAKIYD